MDRPNINRVLFLFVATLLLCTYSSNLYAAEVTLTWTAPDDSRVVGYNVYCGESGTEFTTSPVQSVDSADQTSCLISGLEEGQMYDFAATSRDANGNESDFSETVSYQVASDTVAPEDIDDDGDGYTENQGDCDDTDPQIYPGATEICGDAIDQDCNGSDLDCTSDNTQNTITDEYTNDTSLDYDTIRGGFYISDGKMHGDNWQLSKLYHNSDIGNSDHWVQADVEYNGISDGGGLLCRVNPENQTGYACYMESDRIHLEKFQNSSRTWLDFYDGNYNEGTYTLKMKVVEDTIEVYVNNKLAIQHTDNSYFNGTHVGIRINRGMNNTDITIDNFEAGIVPSTTSDIIDNDGDGYTENEGDCNDNDSSVHPGAEEICGDGIDQDCDGSDMSCPENIDNDGDGYTENEGDCNDNDPTIHPGASEICGDGIDQNCSGNDLTCPEDIDDDGDGYTENQGDCNDNDSSIYPGASEICGDGIDQDCDGNDLTCPEDIDNDGDGYTENEGDCNDEDATIFPGAIEICDDGIDQDCSGSDQDCLSNEETPEFAMETAEIEINHEWQSVSFDKTFDNPVVVAKPMSLNGGQPAIIRINNVTPEGFEIRIQEWEYLDGLHAIEKVSYIAMEAGHHELPGETQVEAGTFETGSTETVSFNQPFNQTPVVLSGVTTENDLYAVTGRLYNISMESFDCTLQEQESHKKGHNAMETMSYIAWEPSAGTINGMDYTVDSTYDEVTHNFYHIPFYPTFDNTPTFLADMQTKDGGDTANIRWKDKTSDGVEVQIDEEQSQNSETNHTTETVGYMAFSSSNGYTIIDTFSEDTSANYDIITGGFNINEGRMHGNDWEFTRLYHNSDIGDKNHWVEADIEYSGGSDGGGLLARVNPENQTGYSCYMESGRVHLVKFQNSSSTWLDLYDGDYGKGTYTLKIQAVENSIEVYVDDTIAIRHNADFNLEGTSAGLMIRRGVNNADVTIDNFKTDDIF